MQMILDGLRLLVRGKLFRDHGFVFKQWIKGFALTLGLLLGVGFFVDLTLGVIVASIVGGAAQPYLFKNIKYT